MKGKYVKEILLKNGYTLSTIAESMGIIPQTLHSLLNAEDIKTGVLESIAKSISKNVYFFFSEELNNERQNIDSNSINERLLKMLDDRDNEIKQLVKKVVELEVELKYVKNVNPRGDTPADVEDAECVGVAG